MWSLLKNERPLTLFLCELMEKAALSHSHITYDDILEDVAVVVRAGSHDGCWVVPVRAVRYVSDELLVFRHTTLCYWVESYAPNIS